MSPYDTYQPFCNDDAVSIAKTQSTQKKPRHRHSPHQLTALNELFELNEHPPLEQRSALAERLGMETKTVNAWFQNKRASSKKRVRGGATSHDSRQTSKSASSVPSTQKPPHGHGVERPDTKNEADDSGESKSMPAVQPVSTSKDKSVPVHAATRQAATHHEVPSHDPRQRLSEEQLEGLRKLFIVNPHPTPEERHALSVSLAMTYDKVTNWFQNQRYQAKKKKEDEEEAHLHAAAVDARQYSAFPPSYPHPSLSFPPPTSHPSLGRYSAMRRSPSISPSVEDRSPRRASSRVGAMPYRSAHPAFSRTRRSRPEPFQLDALKKLFRKTATPTIEERSALALEIGMDVGKVTNWFRNLRQTARRRAKKSGSGDEDDDDFHPQDSYSASSSMSRSGSPSLGSPELYNKEAMMDIVDFDDHRLVRSIDYSDDEYPEAVTPPPEPSPSPPPAAVSSQSISTDVKLEMLLSHLPYPMEIDKASVERFPGIRMEDALLLLSFHHHTVQY